MLNRLRYALLPAIALHATISSAIDLDLTSQDSIKQAASTAAYNMMQQYSGNVSGNTPGLLPGPYYWWEGGAMFGALIDYWYYTGDATYNDVTTQGLQFQVGANQNYEPANQSFDLGNDDQAFWGMAVLSAAEVKFPNPPSSQPQWLALAQAVFNRQVARWDNSTCGGGLRWQIYPYENGYNYKNAISNGCFFNMGARLAKYTGNYTYYQAWAEAAWDWSESVGLIDDKYNVYDGTDLTINCTQVDHFQWSYNVGVYLLGAAYMWNITQAPIWETRVNGLLNAADTFFTNNTAGTTPANSPYIMWEIECEPHSNCDPDQKSFKAYLSRWMAATTKVAPFTTDFVMARLAPSAQAAAAACTGTSYPGFGTTCGLIWTTESWDGTYGIGQQMNALEVIQANLIKFVSAPVTSDTGGTSQGDPTAGTNQPTGIQVGYKITKADKAGAGILTVLFGGGCIAAAVWSVL